MNRDFMDGVWRKIELLEKSDALLSIERTRTRAKARVRPKVVLAAAMLMAFFLGTAAASTDLFEQFRIWMGGFEEGYQAQKDSAIDQGIEISPIAVLCDSRELRILLAVRDLEEDRIRESIDMEIEILSDVMESASYVCTSYGVLDYQQAEHMMLVEFIYEADREYPAKEYVMQVTKIRPLERFHCQISLADLPQEGTILPESGGLQFYNLGIGEDGFYHVRIQYPEKTDDTYGFMLMSVDENGKERFLDYEIRSDGEDGLLTYEDIVIYDLQEEDIGRLTIILEGYAWEEPILGDWTIPLQVKVPEERCFYPEDLTIQNEKIERFSVSEISVHVEATSEDGKLQHDSVHETLIMRMKDGKEIEMQNGMVSAGSINGWVERIDYKWEFDSLFDPNEVEAIILRGVEIPLE